MRYFVAYVKRVGSGPLEICRASVEMPAPIRSIEDIASIEHHLESREGGEVIVTGWQEFAP